MRRPLGGAFLHPCTLVSDPKGLAPPHTTLSFSFSTVFLPPSSIQANSNSPGPGTFMKKDRYGLAEMPGCSSALNTSVPANVAVNILMMLRGMVLPSGSLRWPVSMTWEIRVLTSMTSPTLALSGSLTRGFDILPSPRLAAATADRHLDGALGHQEPAVAQLGNGDDILGPLQTHAAGHHRLARLRREPEGGHTRLRIGCGDDVDGLDVVFVRHRAVDRDGEGHRIAVLGDLRQLDRDLALDRLGLAQDLAHRKLPGLRLVLRQRRAQRQSRDRCCRGGADGKFASAGSAAVHCGPHRWLSLI